jgi:hypothetical protein
MVDGQKDTAPHRQSQQTHTVKKIRHRPDNSILQKKFLSRDSLAFIEQEGPFYFLQQAATSPSSEPKDSNILRYTHTLCVSQSL